MKKLIIALVFGIGLSGFAQESTLKPTQTASKQHKQKHLKKELKSDIKQQEQAGSVSLDKKGRSQEIKAKKEEQKATMNKMTATEKATFKAQKQNRKAEIAKQAL